MVMENPQDKGQLAVVLINPHFILGGVDTYYYRMIHWFQKRGIQTFLYLYEGAPADAQMLEKVQKCGTVVRFAIPVFPGTFIPKPTCFPLDLPEGTRVLVVSTQSGDFWVANQMIYDNPHLKFTNFAYMLHPYAFITGGENPHFPAFCYRPLTHFYQKISRRMLERNIIHFMDETTRQNFLEHYGLEGASDDTILRLGMPVFPFSDQKASERYRQKEFHILAVARLEFPFKSYLLGLVSQFAELQKEYPNLILDIVGWGDGEKELKEKIAGLSPEIQKKIILHGAVEYDELSGFFERAGVFVGMGTTLLDACNAGTIAVTARAFEPKCLSAGFTADNPFWGAMTGEVPASQYIRQVLQLSEEDYAALCYRSHQVVAENYGMDTVIEKMLQSENSVSPLGMTRRELKKVKLFRQGINLLNRMLGRKTESWVKKSDAAEE